MSERKELYINSSAGSTRIAILEDKTLVELYVDLPEHKRMVGNVYKGIIQNVLPGMQAAFIDIGYELNAFLPFSEINNMTNLSEFSLSDNEDDKENKKYLKTYDKETATLANKLKIGDEILVQVIKEPFAGKGARVTTDISIPGNLMVLVKNTNYIGVSKKINDKYEKRRLRSIAKEIKPKNFGLIIRTISDGKSQDVLENDLSKMMEKWNKLDKTIKAKKAPVLAHKDLSTTEHVIRDLFTPDIEKVVVDSKKIFNKTKKYLNEVNPEQTNKLQYFNKSGSLFEIYQIEEQITKSLRKKVWLKSGAYLIIEQTEALLSIDINSGKYIGKKDHEQNSLKINLEAAEEIARQLRLRDIGGLIVIDFIDLIRAVNKRKVFDHFKKLLQKGRAKVAVKEFSDFGLLEMTRQRIKLNLLFTLTDTCNQCSGSGRIKSNDIVLTEMESWLKTFRKDNSDKRLIYHLNPVLYKYVKEVKSKTITSFMWKSWTLIELKKDSTLALDDFKVFSKKRKDFVKK